MNKVEYSRVHTFIEKNDFFANLRGNIKLQVFPKLKLYVESPKVMVNKFVVTNCSTGYTTGQEKATFHSHEDQELKQG